MDKNKLIFLQVILLIGVISAMSVANVTLKTSAGGEAFVNGSIIADKISIQDGKINVINLSTPGYFSNPSAIVDSEITFSGLTDPNNDFDRDGTIIARDVSYDTDFPAGIFTLGYLIVGNYNVRTGGFSVSGGAVREVEKQIYIEVVKEKISWGIVIALLAAFVVFAVYNKKITNFARFFYVKYKKEKKKRG